MMKQVKIIALAAIGLCFTPAARAQACHDSIVTSPSPFLGNNEEIFRLADGSIWQVNHEYKYLYAYSPQVVICPGKNRLIINGQQLRVTLLSKEQSSPEPSGKKPGRSSGAASVDVIETRLAGEFSGWDGETIFKLSNGQIWQQSSYAYRYHYAYRPNVIIFRTGGGYQMQVEGVDQRIHVTRLQ